MTRKRVSKKKKRLKRKSGNLLSLLAFLALLATPAFGDDYALIFGSVFRPSGHALPGAEVTLRPDSGKPQKTKTGGRGEFTFRVAAKPLRYTVIVKAPGYRTESKPVSIQGDERADVTFLMEVEK